MNMMMMVISNALYVGRDAMGLTTDQEKVVKTSIKKLVSRTRYTYRLQRNERSIIHMIWWMPGDWEQSPVVVHAVEMIRWKDAVW